jgi:hypothetical protein
MWVKGAFVRPIPVQHPAHQNIKEDERHGPLTARAQNRKPVPSGGPHSLAACYLRMFLSEPGAAIPDGLKCQPGHVIALFGAEPRRVARGCVLAHALGA